jgi:hypothetical protein
MMSKPIIKDEDWVYLYGELADYILEYSSLDPIWQTDDEGNEIAIRTEEKQDQFKGFAIFGDCLGVFKDGRVLFSDDETGEIRDYSPDKVLKSYDK